MQKLRMRAWDIARKYRWEGTGVPRREGVQASLRGASAASDVAIPVHRGGVLRDADIGSEPMHRDCFVGPCGASSQ
jgi:hypothetical protein